ncbi:cyclase family protein [Halobaculum sp. EA56]|uniref:cyclase family protein n=1 Tax=Halobaculum sp. EA56 TaxID=3421648 RepID=UPI003EBF5F50
MDPLDLTRRIDVGMQTYPGDPEVAVEPSATMAADGYRVTRLSLSTHAGTHVDAPAHTEPDGATLDEFSVGDFRLDARLVDLPGEAHGTDDAGGSGDAGGTDAGLDAREPIEPSMLPDDADGADVLVVRTGWGTHWGADRYFDHPYLTRAAARRVADLGCSLALDTLSPDPSPTARAGDAEREAGTAPDGRATGSRDEPEGVPAHRELLGAGRLVVENLRLPSELPERFRLRAYPLRVDADGAPARAVAE